MEALKKQVGGSHYQGAIQPIEFILANNIPFVEGTIIKYIYRWRDKGGVEDLEKIKHYCDILIQAESNRKEPSLAPFEGEGYTEEDLHTRV